MNVLMFGWEFPPHHSGGLGTACYGLTKALCHRGVNINFILPRKLSCHAPFMNLVYDQIPGSKLNITALNSLLKAYSSTTDYHQLLSQLTPQELATQLFASNLIDEAIQYGRKARNWAKNLPHHLIHSHDWMTYPAGITAAQASGKPLIAHIHATEFDRCASDHVNRQVAEIEYQGLTKADRVIAVSDYTKNTIINKYAINPDKIQVIHNGIETREFSPTTLSHLLPGYQIVLFVGRLTIQKGADYLLQAVPKILQKQPKTIFLIVGDGDLKQQLIIQSAWLGISHRVFFTGFIRDRQQLAHLYQSADLFVMPSVSEPFGIVPLEALANHKPVIISKQSGVSEVINHALKVDFWDTDRLADLIISVLQYPALQQEMALQGHRELQNITWDHAARKTLALYQQLIK